MNRNGASGASAPARVRWQLVEESLDEASFLWRHRQRALSAADRDVRDVTALEERLLGCVDGLHVGGRRAVDRLLAPALRGSEASLVSVAAYVLAADGGQHAWGVLMGELSAARDERAEAMARGLELVERADLLSRLPDVVQGGAAEASPEVLASVVEFRAHRRLHAGPRATELMASGHPRLQRAAVQAARHAVGGGALSVIELGLEQGGAVRDAAVESGLILGSRAAAACCSEVLARLPEGCAPLLFLAALARPDEERQSLLAALGHEQLAAAAVWALGFAGTRWAADACVELLRQGRHTRLAREAFGAITGMELAEAPPLGASSGAGGEPGADEEEAVAVSPDPNAVERWWSRQRSRHDPAVRHLHGRPVTRLVLAEALSAHAMRRRHGIALQLAVLSTAERQLNTRAWCRQQRRDVSRLQQELSSERTEPSHAERR